MKRWPVARRRASSAAITGRSSPPQRSGTGAGSRAPAPASSSRGAPGRTPVESFNGKARDELFAREVFDTILEARVLYEDWREIYDHRRPHSSLGYRAPADFAAVFTKAELS